MGDGRQIYLSKPGGQREGPFTIEQINQALASQKYRDTDFWAWHEGLPEWLPLYNLPGVSPNGPAASPPAPPKPPPPASAPPPAQPKPASPPVPAAAAPKVAAPAAPALAVVIPFPKPETATPPAAEPAPEQVEELAPSHPQLPSGMPVSALEHIFLFATGDGPAAWQSPTVAKMVAAVIGEDFGALPPGIPRDVVGQCAVGALLKPDGSISEAVWSAMASHHPTLVQQARERLYRVFVRTFRIEADAVVALILFYNKQKL